MSTNYEFIFGKIFTSHAAAEVSPQIGFLVHQLQKIVAETDFTREICERKKLLRVDGLQLVRQGGDVDDSLVEGERLHVGAGGQPRDLERHHGVAQVPDTVLADELEDLLAQGRVAAELLREVGQLGHRDRAVVDGV